MFGKPCYKSESNAIKLTAIVLECVCHRLFKYDCSKTDEIDKRSFLKPLFANHDIDTINLGNILHDKSVKSKILPYFNIYY